MKKVLVIGGYGNFGSYITKVLSQEADLKITIAGRSEDKAKAFAAENTNVDYVVTDITKNLDETLSKLVPDIVIHTSGPFQEQGYDVAESCIAHGCHYIDLADGRDFVTGIDTLNQRAMQNNVTVISGASSVPSLSSAIINEYKAEFLKLEEIDYGIATAQQTNRGLATTSAILSYVGQPIKTLINGKAQNIYGWQDMHYEDYPQLGKRLLSNCEIPDLEIFPKAYPDLKTVRFYAGTEIQFMHFGLWLMSWPVRWGWVKSLKPLGPALLKAAYMFDRLGSSNSAFHMHMKGVGMDCKPHQKTIYIIARDGHGPYIPCIPSIVLCKKLARTDVLKAGAYSGLGQVSLPEYLDALKGLDIEFIAE